MRREIIGLNIWIVLLFGKLDTISKLYFTKLITINLSKYLLLTENLLIESGRECLN
jgi:hypothetical protein